MIQTALRRQCRQAGTCVTGAGKVSRKSVFTCVSWLLLYRTTQTQSVSLRVMVIDADGWTWTSLAHIHSQCMGPHANRGSQCLDSDIKANAHPLSLSPPCFRYILNGSSDTTESFYCTMYCTSRFCTALHSREAADDDTKIM